MRTNSDGLLTVEEEEVGDSRGHSSSVGGVASLGDEDTSQRSAMYSEDCHLCITAARGQESSSSSGERKSEQTPLRRAPALRA